MMALVFFAFLSGIMTILSPCILPVLPVVLSAGVSGRSARPFGVITGFIAGVLVLHAGALPRRGSHRHSGRRAPLARRCNDSGIRRREPRPRSSRRLRTRDVPRDEFRGTASRNTWNAGNEGRRPRPQRLRVRRFRVRDSGRAQSRARLDAPASDPSWHR